MPRWDHEVAVALANLAGQRGWSAEATGPGALALRRDGYPSVVIRWPAIDSTPDILLIVELGDDATMMLDVDTGMELLEKDPADFKSFSSSISGAFSGLLHSPLVTTGGDLAEPAV